MNSVRYGLPKKILFNKMNNKNAIPPIKPNMLNDVSKTQAFSFSYKLPVLTIITKHSILDVAAVLDPPLNRIAEKNSTNKSSLCPYEVAICSRSSMHEKKVSSSFS